jgi:hypothetical protein
MNNIFVYSGLGVLVLSALSVLLAALSVVFHALNLSKAASVVDKAKAIDDTIVQDAKAIGVQPPSN